MYFDKHYTHCEKITLSYVLFEISQYPQYYFEQIQRLYGKYLRAESFRKALIYQKKYLLLLLGGFQDTEETTLALLARMGATPAIESLHYRQYKLPPITTFRSAVRVVIAITR